MFKFMRIFAFLLIVVTVLSCCGQRAEDESKQGWDSTEITTFAASGLKDVSLSDDGEEACFSITADDFIDNFNAAYIQDYGFSFLPPKGEWIDYGAGGEAQKTGEDISSFRIRNHSLNRG